MGKLYYGNSADGVEIPDETLAHLQVLIATKLRRSESFSLSWDRVVDGAVQRESVWLHCSIPLRFQLDDAEGAGRLDRKRLQDMATAANSTAGVLVDLREESAVRARRTPRVAELVPAA